MTNQEAIEILEHMETNEFDEPIVCDRAIEKAIEALRAGWISVKDALPKDAGTYIIVDHYGNVMSRHFCKSQGKFAGYWHFNGSAKYGNPTHWMKMPEPPKEE